MYRRRDGSNLLHRESKAVREEFIHHSTSRRRSLFNHSPRHFYIISKGLDLRFDVNGIQTKQWLDGLKKCNVNRYVALIASVDYQFIQIFRVNATLRIISAHNTRPQGVYNSCFYTLFCWRPISLCSWANGLFYLCFYMAVNCLWGSAVSWATALPSRCADRLETWEP